MGDKLVVGKCYETSEGKYVGKYLSEERGQYGEPSYLFDKERGIPYYQYTYREVTCNYDEWKEQHRIADEAKAAARAASVQSSANMAKRRNAELAAYDKIELTDGASLKARIAPGKGDGTIQVEFYGSMYEPNYNRKVGPIKDRPYYHITPDKRMIQQLYAPALDKHLLIITETMGLTLVPKARGGKRRRLTRKLQKKKRRGTAKTK